MTAGNTPIGTTSARPGSTPAGAIRSVSVVSTGTVQIHPQHVSGSRLPLTCWLVGSRQWTPPRPINVYVIEHADGLVLFDTGQDRASVTDPGYFPGGVTGFLYGRLARFRIAPDETLVAKLAVLGHGASDVRLAILSHLHQDHIGGIRYLPNAEFMLAAAEWRAMERPRSEMNGFLRRHIDLPGIRYRRIGFVAIDDPALAPFTSAHDVTGDGSLVLLPVPGHTPGSTALLVRRPGVAPLLMVGDLTYEADLLGRAGSPASATRRACTPRRTWCAGSWSATPTSWSSPRTIPVRASDCAARTRHERSRTGRSGRARTDPRSSGSSVGRGHGRPDSTTAVGRGRVSWREDRQRQGDRERTRHRRSGDEARPPQPRVAARQPMIDDDRACAAAVGLCGPGVRRSCSRSGSGCRRCRRRPPS